MKKTLMAAMAIVAITFGACKKDLTTQTAQEPKTSATKQKVNALTNYYYLDLTLQPRQPGENFDTYLGSWGGSQLKVIGSPVWNNDLYPQLQNGVPLSGASYVPTGQDMISVASSANQDIFTLSVATMSATNFQAFQQDVSKFNTAFSTYVDLTNQGVSTNIPNAGDYIKESYNTGQPGYVAVPGKLIRVTTGSHIAIATPNYPLPAITPSNVGVETVGNLQDPAAPGTYYTLEGKNGNITSTRTPGVTVLGGHYTHGAGSTIYHFWGTLKRANGTTFTFDETQDIA